MQSHALQYWANGNDPHEIGFGDEDGHPFVVTARNQGWIPINHLVFAKDGEAAIRVIKDALREILKRDYRTKPHADPDGYLADPTERVNRLLGLSWEAHPYNKKLVSHVQWADNATII
jgi:hypothetical protein